MPRYFPPSVAVTVDVMAEVMAVVMLVTIPSIMVLRPP